MEQYIIKGGVPLVGEVEIGGAKNAALAILAAATMTDDTVLIENVPDVRDTNVMMQAMESGLLCRSRRNGRSKKMAAASGFRCRTDQELLVLFR